MTEITTYTYEDLVKLADVEDAQERDLSYHAAVNKLQADVSIIGKQLRTMERLLLTEYNTIQEEMTCPPI